MESSLEGVITALGEALKTAINGIGEELANSIFNTLIKWLYETIFGAMADFFELIGNMGAEIFDLAWVNATIKLFSLLGWLLFAIGTVIAVFDAALEYQNGGGSIRNTALNVLKGFFAVNLFTVLPIELYKFCISLQNTFSHELASLMAVEQSTTIAEKAKDVLTLNFNPTAESVKITFLFFVILIAFSYSVVSVFFQNIKRGGILLIQVCVGSLYMISIPRGYSDSFVNWIKTTIGICFTAFIQASLLYLGLITFQGNLLLGLGIMLATTEVPKIAGVFGLDTSMRASLSSTITTSNATVNLLRNITR